MGRLVALVGEFRDVSVVVGLGKKVRGLNVAMGMSLSCL